jgi:hypothetical protein
MISPGILLRRTSGARANRLTKSLQAIALVLVVFWWNSGITDKLLRRLFRDPPESNQSAARPCIVLVHSRENSASSPDNGGFLKPTLWLNAVRTCE